MTPPVHRSRSVPEEAFDLLRARYSEARHLLSLEGDCANLDWILGRSSGSDLRTRNLNRGMIALLSLWLEDLAVELDRDPERALHETLDAPIAAARRACESAAAGLRQATSGFLAALQSAD